MRTAASSIGVWIVLALGLPAAVHAQPVDWDYKWRLWLGDGGSTMPAIGPQGELYLVWRGKLHAIRPDGTVSWTLDGAAAWDMDSLSKTPVVGDDGAVYLRALRSVGDQGNRHLLEDRYLVAVDPRGTERWRAHVMPLGVDAVPYQSRFTVSLGPGGMVYVTSDSTIYALDAHGSTVWNSQLGGTPTGSSTGSDGTLYVGASDGHLYAVAPNGQLKWRHDTGAYIECPPTIDQSGIVYLPGAQTVANPPPPPASRVKDEPGELLALDGTGELLWRLLFPREYSRYPAVLDEDGNIILSEPRLKQPSGTVYSVSPDGELLWEAEVVNDGRDMLVDRDGRVLLAEATFARSLIMALDVRDGTELWRIEFLDSIRPRMTMGPDGTLYVISDGVLYAMDVGSTGLARSAWPKQYADARNSSRCVSPMTAVAETVGARPSGFRLLPAYPNPFNASVAFRYELGLGGMARLAVYDVAGQLVEVLVEGEHGAGTHEAVWDAVERASGVYLVELRVGAVRDVERVALVR